MKKLQNAGPAPSPLGQMPPNDGMPGGQMPPGFFPVSYLTITTLFYTHYYLFYYNYDKFKLTC